MKKFIGILMVLIGFTVNAQSVNNVYTIIGMPGDNLNLSLVLDIFKQASSIQDFERKLNDPDKRVNNLDLNNDGTIDYLKVTDYGKGNYHTIIIQDIVSANETQDVAIIDIEKKNGNLVHVQIIGDESLYGKNYIIEPQIETAQKYQSNNQQTTVINNNYYVNQNPIQYVNAWGWPCVNIIFSNAYSPWVSPWHWAYYPSWWNPRPRVIYNVYYSYHNGFGWNNYCRRNNYFNQKQYYHYYQNRRVTSNIVQVNVTKNVFKNNSNNNGNNNNPRSSTYNNTNQNNSGNDGNNSGKWNNGNIKNSNGKTNTIKDNQNVNIQNQPRNNNPKWSGNNSDNNSTSTNSSKWKNNNSGNQNSGSQNSGQWSNPNKPTKSTTTPSGFKSNINNNGGFNNNSNGNGGVKIERKAK